MAGLAVDRGSSGGGMGGKEDGLAGLNTEWALGELDASLRLSGMRPYRQSPGIFVVHHLIPRPDDEASSAGDGKGDVEDALARQLAPRRTLRPADRAVERTGEREAQSAKSPQKPAKTAAFSRAPSLSANCIRAVQRAVLTSVHYDQTPRQRSASTSSHWPGLDLEQGGYASLTRGLVFSLLRRRASRCALDAPPRRLRGHRRVPSVGLVKLHRPGKHLDDLDP